jgi:hypothetical protein
MTWTKVNTALATVGRTFTRFVRSVSEQSEQSKKESIPETINTIYGKDTKIDVTKFTDQTDPRAILAKDKSLSEAYSIFTKAPGYDYLPEVIRFSNNGIELCMDKSCAKLIQLPISDDGIVNTTNNTFWQNIKKVYTNDDASKDT